MTKVMSLVRISTSVSPVEFRSYWATEYLRSILTAAGTSSGISRVVHNHVVPISIREDAEHHPGDWAGVSETWFDSRGHADAFLASPAVAQAIASHRNVLPEVVHLHCSELMIWDLGLERPSVKLLAFFHPSSTMTREQSQRYWTHEHVRIGSELNNPTRFAPRYLQNHMLPDFHTSNPEYDFAGAPELWFSSENAAKRLFLESSATNMQKLAADEAKFSDRRRTISFVTDEHLVHTRA